MTEERYLVAHKVRGEPAFDVAIKMQCPKCLGRASQECIDGPMFCSECDDHGWWWIIPTSGHRAHPWWSTELKGIGNMIYMTDDQGQSPRWVCGFMPNNLPEHYQDSRAPAPSRPAFLDKLIKSKAPSTPIPRRGF